jgi:UDP-N-acetylmuramyl pentapeptide phosphotransferase/UDP-N-acetylglucosamine-1-phosphate transferase
MHVWRLPLVNFASLLSFAAVVIVWEGVAWLRRHSTSDLARRCWLALGGVAALSSPFIVHLIVDPELRDLAAHDVYVHYGATFYLGPGFAAAVLFVLSRRAVPERSRRVREGRTAFWLTAAALATLNLANWCSPGWCQRFGFPFRYSWWSDAVVVMNGVNLTAGTSSLAIIADVIVLLVAAVVAARACGASLQAP